MNKAYISTLDKIDEQYHRSHVIVHKDWKWHFADFNNLEQLQLFADTLGFTYKLDEEKAWFNGGTYRRYSISHKIADSLYYMFWNQEQIPFDAKPVKALSNGSIVTCYYTNDGETITIYRPNPNAKEVYKPLNIAEHIAHVKTYGLY